MKFILAILLVLLLVGNSIALGLILDTQGTTDVSNVQPGYIGIKDTGSESLPTLDVGISINCYSKQLTVTVSSNESGDVNGIANANIYLFYTDYGYQLVSNGKTGENGISRMNVTGKVDYLTALFILRVDAQGYRSREIEFRYSRCFDTQPGDEETGTAGQSDAQDDGQSTEQIAHSTGGTDDSASGNQSTQPTGTDGQGVNGSEDGGNGKQTLRHQANETITANETTSGSQALSASKTFQVPAFCQPAAGFILTLLVSVLLVKKQKLGRRK